jgi:hypothetical protein
VTPNSTTATITVAVAGRRPQERHVEYSRLINTIDRLREVNTTNKWLKRLVTVKLAQAHALAIVISTEEARHA